MLDLEILRPRIRELEPSNALANVSYRYGYLVILIGLNVYHN